MQLAFASRELRDCFETEDQLILVYGAELGNAIMRALSDLLAASCVQELPPETFRHDPSGEAIFVFIASSIYLRAKPNHLNPPLTGDGQVDWYRVSRLLIEDIENVE